MSMRQIPMGNLRKVAVGGVFAFVTASFGRIHDNLSQLCKSHFPCVANNIGVASSRTYVFHWSVPTVPDNASDIKDGDVDR